MTLSTLLTAHCDAPEPWLLGFQDGASPTFEGVTELHDTIFFYLIVIGVAVGWVLASVVVSFMDARAPIAHRYSNHGTLIEVVWTVTPALVLVAIAFPSFKLLYLMDCLLNDLVHPRSTTVCVHRSPGPSRRLLNALETTMVPPSYLLLIDRSIDRQYRGRGKA